MDYANPVLMELRKAGQRLGILRPLLRVYRNLRRSAYEEKFDRYIVSRVSAGDIVWDVGANVGFFTAKFAAAAGKTGKVIAFEPAPGAYSVLRRDFSHNDNVVLENLALADFDGSAEFAVSDDPTDPTNGLAVTGKSSATVEVQVCRGISYLAQHPDRAPNRIKIDVEGFELEVLRGLSDTLRERRVKSIFIEVHFDTLRQRGLPRGPSEIKSLLQQAGFAVRWIDPSHLAAERVDG